VIVNRTKRDRLYYRPRDHVREFQWEILLNRIADTPFFTSDFPIAIDDTNHPPAINRIVPLAPHIAVRLCGQPLAPHERLDFSFSRLERRIREVSRHEVVSLNRLIVRCAETTVFFRDDHDPRWTPKTGN
jgi:hypothetical protein